MNGGHGVAQHQRLTRAGNQSQRVEPGGFRRQGLQVEFQDAAFGNTVVAHGVDAADQGTKLIRDVGQERTHGTEATVTLFARANAKTSDTPCVRRLSQSSQREVDLSSRN